MKNRIDLAVDRANRLYDESQTDLGDPVAQSNAWFQYWDIVEIELPWLEDAYERILAEIPGHLPPP
jgi:hypothetical protein